LLLVKVLKFFNFSVVHVRFVFYAPHHTHTRKQWNKIRNIHQTVLTEQSRGVKLFYTLIRTHGYKER
jgi:hypothetical protein